MVWRYALKKWFSFMCRQTTIAAALLMPFALAAHADAAGVRRWSLTLSGPDHVAAGRDYLYTATLSNDGGDWPSSGGGEHTLRLAFDLNERYGDGTVGIEDILIHPGGPQAPDGSFPCDALGGCWFRRSGSRVNFSFTRDNASVGPMVFGVVIHTASIFRPGDSFRLSAALQDDGNGSGDGSPGLAAPDGDISAAITATFPLACRQMSDECIALSST